MEVRTRRSGRKRSGRRYLSDGAHLFFSAAGAGLAGTVAAVPLLSLTLSRAPLAWFLTSFYAYAGLAPVYLLVLGMVGGSRLRTSGAFLVVGSLLSALVGLGSAEAVALSQPWLEPVSVRLLVGLAWGAATCIGGLVVHHLTLRYVEPC